MYKNKQIYFATTQYYFRPLNRKYLTNFKLHTI